MTKYRVAYGGPVLGEEESKAVAETMSAGRFWDGDKTHQFERLLCEKTGAQDAVFTNSGSSALLLALEAAKDMAGLKRGDKVLTAALTFPTAVNIIVQQGYVPIFMDVAVPSLQVGADTVEGAIKKFKPKAAVITHIIGNSPNMGAIKDSLATHGVVGIEDACDCLGGTYEGHAVGTILDFGCYSFHPAHPLTAGIGGAVVTRNQPGETLRRYRDWGRIPQDFIPEERFFTYLGERLDKRYTYSHLAYNLMCSELHAAIGIEQLKKLDKFIARRKVIFGQIREALKDYTLLVPPDVDPKADPVWFGYPVTQLGPHSHKEGAMHYLENRQIETRSIYGGPVIIQPAYNTPPIPKYEVYGSSIDNLHVPDLRNSMFIHNNSFWISCWHGLHDDDVTYLTQNLKAFMDRVLK